MIAQSAPVRILKITTQVGIVAGAGAWGQVQKFSDVPPLLFTYDFTTMYRHWYISLTHRQDEHLLVIRPRGTAEYQGSVQHSCDDSSRRCCHRWEARLQRFEGLLPCNTSGSSPNLEDHHAGADADGRQWVTRARGEGRGIGDSLGLCAWCGVWCVLYGCVV